MSDAAGKPSPAPPSDPGLFGDLRRPPGPPDKQFSTVMQRLARTVADASVKNIATIFAVSGLAFYLVGIVRRVAILEAEGVPTSRGIPVTSLQDYLVQGLGVVIDPITLLSIVLVMAVIAGILVSVRFVISPEAAAPRSRSEVSAVAAAQQVADRDTATEPAAVTQTSAGGRGRNIGRFVVGAVLGAGAIFVVGYVVTRVIFLPPANWAPLALAGLPIAAMLIAYQVPALGLPAWNGWTDVHARVAALVFGGVLLAYVLASMWLAPPTLDTATLHSKVGGKHVGGLLATANGSIYLVNRPPGSHAAKITAFPIGELSGFEITTSDDRRYTSLANRLGWTDDKWPPHEKSCAPYPGVLKSICDYLSEQ